MDRSPGTVAVSSPVVFASPENQLPSIGKLGDLWASFTTNEDPQPPEGIPPGPQPRCHLWLCVRAGAGANRPLWAQVLLGKPVEGRHPLPSDL
jgi:hypothetical protein